MYTSCPECGTVFRIGPAELRRAAGRVRCGNCGTAFSALESLSDRGPDEAAEQGGPPAVAETGSTPEPEALEFNVPPDHWSSFFAGSAAEPDAAVTPDPDATSNPDPLDAAASDDWDDLLAELPGDEDEAPAAVYVIDTPRTGEQPADPAPQAQATAPADPEPDYPREQLASTVDLPPVWERLYPAPTRAGPASTPPPAPAPRQAGPVPALLAAGAGTAGDEPGHDDITATDSVPPPPFRTPRARQRRRWPWLLGSLLLLIVLAGQWLHLERDTLAAHPAWGEPVRQAYAQLGLPLYPAWDLGAYRVLGSEAIAGRAAPEALEIVARLQVTGAAPVGLPLLRVIVRDRWGNTVGERLVTPGEYAPERTGQLVTPGSVLPVTVSLRDPGTEAHGYEIDLCVPRRDQGMACQLDRPVFRR